MDRIDALLAFLAVADEGGFKKAADKLDISNQLVSKYVAQLEDYLNARLFNRTTRQVHLTEAGQQCYQYAVQILENLHDMEGQLGQLQTEAQGLLHISAPVSFSTRHLVHMIRDFKHVHPAVGIDLQLNDRKVDVVEEGFDVALRIGHLANSSLIARRVASVKLVLCASPEYLEQNGTPETPEALIPEHHLRYRLMLFNQSGSRLFSALKRSPKRGAEIASNNGEILAEAAIAGLGYALQPTFIVGEAIKAGRLKVILPEFSPEPMALYAVYPHRKLLTSKLRTFVDFLCEYYGDQPYWDDFN